MQQKDLKQANESLKPKLITKKKISNLSALEKTDVEKNKKNKKVLFKKDNLVQIIKVESFKKYNKDISEESYSLNEQSNSLCECYIY